MVWSAYCPVPPTIPRKWKEYKSLKIKNRRK